MCLTPVPQVALLDYSLVPTPGSELAAAALLLALLLAQPQDCSASVRPLHRTMTYLSPLAGVEPYPRLLLRLLEGPPTAYHSQAGCSHRQDHQVSYKIC